MTTVLVNDHSRLEVARRRSAALHRDHRELQGHRRDEPAQVVDRELPGLRISAEAVRVCAAQRKGHDEENAAGDPEAL